ncbi:hypothetical protein [Methylosinus sp. Sm6]|uniref:hypothetical protein n=1 Tax=Methylosinus sp. Sm6 TaxID=2866948 RepID=UPI001C9A0BDA|nr:hypothetical protein [Methylosinus sp. Sm6]MBY6242614.1 hypothetical protein [Methylosinus sp. Sm6]
MYVGHFAAGLLIIAKAPTVKPLPILMGVGLLDIVNGLAVMTGIDHVTPNLASGPYLYFDLTFIDWDHSLLMAILLSVFWGALFFRDARLALLAGVASFSHFLLDLPLHNSDLALYPHAERHLGGGLWASLGIGAWLLEGAFSALLVAGAWRLAARRRVSLAWPAAFLAVLFIQLSPWLSPTKFIASLPEPYTHLLLGLVITLGFIAPGVILTILVANAERRGRQSIAEHGIATLAESKQSVQ